MTVIIVYFVNVISMKSPEQIFHSAISNDFFYLNQTYKYYLLSNLTFYLQIAPM